ncbi:efflux transporter outer membrane subunit [Aliagarivorans marinus]|uniref:efflux transporter outer membrane subunit n=1 Tax=Aliagarivorans marinus TaxID=561965 RepID=UPI00047B5374|nr:efflux transporter outer membrane subunit [Aliagarivorans marinus]
MMRNTLSAIAIAALLSACSMTPEAPQSELGLHSEFLYQCELATQASQQLHWWSGFEDPMLNELVEQAQQQNITLQVAAERVKAAQAYQQAVNSLKVPTISLGGGYSSFRLSENEALAGPIVGASVMGQPLVDNQSGNFFLGAGIVWEADLFGKIDAMSQAAAIRSEQVTLMQDGLQIAISGELISNYFHMRGAQQRQLIVEKSIDDQLRAISLIETLVDTGIASQLDLARSKAMLASTKALMPQLASAETVHKQRIAIILGDNSRELQQRLSEVDALPDFAGVIPVGLPSELLQRRPDIKAQELEMVAQNHELGAAIAARYPSFYLSGSPGLLAKDFDKLFESDSGAWLATVGLKWNVFDGGRSEAQVALKEAQLQSAVLGYQDSVNTAIAEVEMLLKAYGDNHLYHEKASEAQHYGETALARANTLYQAGLIDQLELIDAQRQQLALDEQELSARMQTAQLVVNLHKALGGDWTASESNTDLTN